MNIFDSLPNLPVHRESNDIEIEAHRFSSFSCFSWGGFLYAKGMSIIIDRIVPQKRKTSTHPINAQNLHRKIFTVTINTIFGSYEMSTRYNMFF